jgi:hypothetical protein
MSLSIYIYNCQHPQLCSSELQDVAGHGRMDNAIILNATYFTVKAFVPSRLLSVADIWETFIALITSLLERRPSAADDPRSCPQPLLETTLCGNTLPGIIQKQACSLAWLEKLFMLLIASERSSCSRRAPGYEYNIDRINLRLGRRFAFVFVSNCNELPG